MRAGQLRHRISVQVLSEQADSFGQLIPTYTTAFTIWGYVKPVTSTEDVQADQVRITRTHVITTRYFPGLISTSRFQYNNRIFNITGIRNLGERNREYEIDCKEVAIG